MKKFIVVVSLLFGFISIQAQPVFHRYLHNVDFSLGGGLHSVQFDPEQGGDHRMRAGGTFNMQYRYAGWDRLSLAIGLGFTTYSGKSIYDFLQDTLSFVDTENGETYTYKETFYNWNEVQRSLDVEVPIAAYYRYPINETWGLVGGLGAKLDLPVSKKFVTKNGSDGELTRTGEFESTNVEYSELPQHGFYDSDEYEGKAKMKGYGVSVFGELGVTRPLKNNASLYMGTYFSHSVINTAEKSAEPLWNPETDTYCGVVSSKFVDKTHNMAFGIKIGYSLGWPKAMLIDTAAERLLAEQREAERLAAERAIEEARLAAEKAMLDSLAAAQAEADRIAAEQAEAERLAAEKKAEEERLAAEKAEQERLEAERLVAEKLAQEELRKAEEAVEWINKHIVVNFELGKAVINPDEKIEANIQFLVGFMEKYPERGLVIKGHTCDLGNYQKNKVLSKQRAEAMKKILVDKGCIASRIETIGMGPDEPLVPNTCEENRKKNRRIEIQINHILKE